MRTSITFRLLLVTNALAVATVAAVAVLAGWISGSIVEGRLVHDTALQTAKFLQTSRLPTSDKLMLDLREIFGGHFAAVRTSDLSVVGTSFPPEDAAEFQRQLRSNAGTEEMRVGNVDYRVGSHSILRLDASGAPREPVRFYVLMRADDLKQAGRLARLRTLLAAAPAVVVPTILGLVLSLTIIRPIRKLAREMDQMAARHDGVAPADAPAQSSGALPARRGPLEVAQLATSFDRLLARLARVQDELVRSQRLAALGRVAASAAHELKNPLSGIRMHLRLLQDEPGLASQKEDLDVLLREIERMDLYLQELTDVASGGAAEGAPGPVPPGHVENVDLSDTVASVMRLLEGRCRHAGVAVRYDYHVKPPRALAAPDRLRQVLMNLIINAIEAMPDGGSIIVGTKATPSGRVRLTVTDTGRGIKDVPPERVFDLFVSTKGQGTGLGLYIARQLVLAQGGEIGCENTGHGASFWIELPAAGPDAGPQHDTGSIE